MHYPYPNPYRIPLYVNAGNCHNCDCYQRPLDHKSNVVIFTLSSQCKQVKLCQRKQERATAVHRRTLVMRRLHP